MPNLVALSLMVSDKKIFKDFENLCFVAMATRVFQGIKFFEEILKRTMAGHDSHKIFYDQHDC